MEIWSSALVSAVLVCAGGGLMAWHVAVWRRLRGQDLEARMHDYSRRQFVRRMQISGMLVLLGVAMISGQALIPWVHSKLFAALYLGGVLALILWIVLLSLADILATQQHFRRMRTDNLIERAKLQAEARRLEREKGSNGRAGKGGKP